jgi:V/A-type H+/Na+-transporting ATPase subunit K
MKSSFKLAAAFVALTLVMGIGATALFVSVAPVHAAGPAASVAGATGDAWSFGLIAAAVSTALAALGAGFAVARVGTAAIGALAEKPELFGRLLIFVGLAEGIAIYGLIVSILILNRLT